MMNLKLLNPILDQNLNANIFYYHRYLLAITPNKILFLRIDIFPAYLYIDSTGVKEGLYNYNLTKN